MLFGTTQEDKFADYPQFADEREEAQFLRRQNELRQQHGYPPLATYSGITMARAPAALDEHIRGNYPVEDPLPDQQYNGMRDPSPERASVNHPRQDAMFPVHMHQNGYHPLNGAEAYQGYMAYPQPPRFVEVSPVYEWQFENQAPSATRTRYTLPQGREYEDDFSPVRRGWPARDRGRGNDDEDDEDEEMRSAYGGAYDNNRGSV